MSKPFEVDEVLAKLAEIRKSLPLGANPPRRREEGVAALSVLTMEEFERAAVVDALESMAAELQTVIDGALESAYEQALDAYYVAEELSRRPGHAGLIPHVESMRIAHEETYGRAIPPRLQTEVRRQLKRARDEWQSHEASS